MPEGIWGAIGAALQQGGHTFGALTAEENERKEREVLRQQEQARYAQQLEMQKRQQEQAELDRRRNFIRQSILDSPETAQFEGSQIAEAKELGLNHLLNPATKTQRLEGISGLGAFGEPLGSPEISTTESATRRLSVAEEAQKATAAEQLRAREQAEQYRQWVAANPSASPQQRFTTARQFGQKFEGLSPEETVAQEKDLTKFKTEQEMRVAGVRANATQASQNAAILQSAAERIIADPAQYHRLSKTTQAKLDPILSSLGFQFPAPPPNPYNAERAFRVGQSVEELSGQVGHSTTGMLGSFLRRIPGTAAKDFAAELNTLKSNIMVNELQEMRAASKTGGALGQVSDKEGALLADSLGALDQDQSPANVAKQLLKIKATLDRWAEAKATLQNNGMVSVPIRNPQGEQLGGNPAAPKVGERKQFPNGSTGVWDGQGWVKQ